MRIRPVAHGQAAHEPIKDFVDHLIGHADHQGDEGAQEGAHHHTGQNHGFDPGFAPVGGKPEYRSQRKRAGQKRHQRHRPLAQRLLVAEENQEGGADRAARSDTQGIRVGQRIAEHTLEARARRPQSSAYQNGQHHPGQPDFEDNLLMGIRPIRRHQASQLRHPGEQNAPDLQKRQPGRA
ncbi:hypothetical protein D3C81_1705200 [compost metagenome]